MKGRLYCQTSITKDRASEIEGDQGTPGEEISIKKWGQ